VVFIGRAGAPPGPACRDGRHARQAERPPYNPELPGVRFLLAPIPPLWHALWAKPMNTSIMSLGPGHIRSPLQHGGPLGVRFLNDAERVLLDDTLAGSSAAFSSGQTPVSFEVAGPREQLYFDPHRTIAGIVTCGGLCPGLNDVIRGLVHELNYRYRVTHIFGFRYGFEGLIPRYGHTPMSLKPESLAAIHNFGGTILGTSRGPQNAGEMAELLDEMKIDLLFVIGGDGTLRGAAELNEEISRRGLKKSIIGIPKTIDNDIMYLDKSFGFETAFAEAVKVINSAHAESLGSVNGVGLVKLMGRDSGFIASFAALAGNVVDFVLIPEVPFQLEGARGFLEALRYHLTKRKQAVVVVAEGAGQDLLPEDALPDADASGNVRLADIGLHLKDRINAFFRERRMQINLKYIDPSYIIRSVPASPQDNVYCTRLAQNAVHAAMAGKTNMVIGRWHGTFIHLPLHLVTHGRRKIDPHGELWHSVLEKTGQPGRLY
jgi:6-phosphofructokinase 1